MQISANGSPVNAFLVSREQQTVSSLNTKLDPQNPRNLLGRKAKPTASTATAVVSITDKQHIGISAYLALRTNLRV